MTFSNIQWEPQSKREARRQEMFTLKTLKSEAIFDISLLELNFAQRVLFERIEISYNRRRRHSAINHLTIPEFKQSFIKSKLVA